MKTPVLDFVRRYAKSDTLRLHMPGHKGKGVLGAESFDITEIEGADSLYAAGGILAESEKNASSVFGGSVFYSAEGASLAVRAMLYLSCLYAKRQGKQPKILAGRNAHKSFLSAAALLDFEVKWLQSAEYLSCKITPSLLKQAVRREKPTAVYITSPDYLGNMADVRALAAVCRAERVLLLVDAAHGAYLKFLSPSQHPLDLGADMCCASAHKTLPVLTGGAYLHIAQTAPALFCEQAKNALALFGSTSPSYLILASLDFANAYMANGLSARLIAADAQIRALKGRLQKHGYRLIGDEPLKLTLSTKPYGYTGTAFAACLREMQIEIEFADRDFAVLMLAPDSDLTRLERALLAVPRKTEILEKPPVPIFGETVISPRAAMLADRETVSVRESVGRILASPSVSCPPAVPVVLCGERITEAAVQAFLYYGTESVTVVR